MKFLNLQIKNINSIADAEIDFENLLTKDEHIFLIWGPSGAGKTTILDAICLALFKKVPRFESASEKRDNKYIDREFQFPESKGREISTNDIRQFLKRGTKEGLCRLKYIGNDNKEYTSQIKFSINKKNTLNDVEWILTTPDSILDKNRDIEPEIQRTTGLSYEQFCRTTLLAQGEFTKFMKSDQNAKAEILEKLTDTRIFSDIGRRIFEKHKDIESKYNLLKNQNENIARLTDAEINELELDKTQAEEEKDKIASELEDVEKKKNWLERCVELQGAEKVAVEDLENKKKYAEADSIKKYEKDIKLWEKTGPQRNILSQIEKCDKDDRDFDREKTDLRSEFDALCAGNNHLTNLINKKEKKLTDDEDEKHKYSNRLNILKDLSSFKESLIQYDDLSKKNADNNTIISKKEQRIAEKISNIKSIENRLSECLEKINKTKSNLEVLKDKKQKLNYEVIVESKSNLESEKKTLNEIKQITIILKENSKNTENQINKKKILDDFLCSAEKKLENCRNEYENAKKNTENAQKCFDSAAQSVKEFAKQMRATLKIGDNCPVCGHKVEKVLSDEAVEASVAAVKSALEQAQKHESESKFALDSLISEKTRKESELEGCKTALVDLKRIKDQQLGFLKSKCDAVGLNIDKNLISQIDDKIISLEKDLIEIEQSLKMCSKINNAINDEENILKIIDEEHNKALKSKHSEELELGTLKSDMNHLLSQNESNAETLKLLYAKLNASLSEFYPEWSKKPLDAANNISRDAKRVAELDAEIAGLNSEISSIKKDISRFEKFANEVSCLFDWPICNELEEADNLDARWNDIVKSSSVLSSKITKNGGLKSQLKDELVLFFENNSEIDDKILAYLSSLDYKHILKMRGDVENAHRAVVEATTRLEVAKETLKQHVKVRPQIEEFETIEFLGGRIFEYKTLRDNKIQYIADISLRLKTDEQNKKKYADMLSELDKKKRELDKWEQLKYWFGDSEGKKFRKIAQSFILQKLLDNTNYFLAQFSDRYQLTKGHDLLILVEDKYLNGSTRPIETVSGGESFLVSIALALGLSNMSMSGYRPDYIFIDEGISQLDGVRCDAVVNTLQQLHDIVKCNIGIVSHLDKLQDMIPTKVNVFPVSQGTSKVEVRRFHCANV